MARDTEETPTPEHTTGDETEERTETPAPSARKPRRPRARTGARAKKAEGTPPEPTADPGDLVVRGESIRNDSAETILSNVDVGPAEAEAPGAALAPVVITTVETITVEDTTVHDPADDLGAADMIVDMLNGLAGADAGPHAGPSAGHPFWYVMSLQVEEAQRTAASHRKAGRIARKLARQIDRAARALQDVFERAASDAGVMDRHQRAIARLVALLDVTPPRDRDEQRVFAKIIRAERRSLIDSIEGAG